MTILRGETPYMVVKEIGELDAKGKKVFSVGYSGKRISKPEYPLASLLIPLLSDLVPLMRYDSREVFDRDIGEINLFIRSLQYNDGTEKPTDQTHPDAD